MEYTTKFRAHLLIRQQFEDDHILTDFKHLVTFKNSFCLQKNFLKIINYVILLMILT